VARNNDIYYPLSILKEGVFLKGLGKIVLAVLIILIFFCASEIWASSIIKGIRIRGNQYVKSEEITKVIKSKVGESLSEQKIREDMQAIYDMGFFSDLSVFKEEEKDGLILTFQVKENGKIDKIDLKGVDSEEINKVRKLLTFKEGDLWNFTQIKESRDKITQFYYKKGFFSASVNILFEDNNKSGHRVIINVQKGERVRIKKVEIKGNSSFSDSQLRALMKTRFGRFFNKDTLANDLEKVTHYYQNYGYYFACVKSSHFEFSEEGGVKWITIFLEIVEGKKFFVSAVEIKGENKIFSDDEILSQFKPGKGELFVPDYLKDSINVFQDKYGEKGYIYVQIKPDLRFDRKKGEVNIILQIKEGLQVRVGKIRIEGNKFSQQKIFKHTFTLKEGDIFNVKKLREGWRRLYNLGFFEKVEIEPVFTTSPSVVDLLIKVEEVERKGQFYIGAGYGSASGLQGNIQFFKDNLWGEGKKIGIDWQFGEKRDEYNITYLDRWWADTSIRLEPCIYKKRDRYNRIDGDYEKEAKGRELRVGKPIWELAQVYISLRDEEIKITDVGEAGMPEGMEEGKKTSHSLKFALDRNTRVRDEAFNPYQGSFASISTEMTGGPILGGDLTLSKYRGEWRGYLRRGAFWKSPIIAYRLRVMLGEDLPAYEKFRVGGMETLRGYEENEFRGEKVLLGNLELRLPLSKDFLGSLFVDTGKVWNKSSSIDKLGWGFGIRMRTVIGFIRLDYGIGERGGQFYFGMGEGF